jgi:hypothetical protein
MRPRERLLSSDNERERPTQQSQPKNGEPIEIPMPKRDDFDKLVHLGRVKPKGFAVRLEDPVLVRRHRTSAITTPRS